MKKTLPAEWKLAAAAFIALGILLLGICAGSSRISPAAVFRIILHKAAGAPLPEWIDPRQVTILWVLRLPRVLLAFFTGGALALCGAVFQSLLRNQLASPYILGVSSGASLGAGLFMLSGLSIPLLGFFALPAAGFTAALVTLAAVVAFSSKIDKNLSNNTIILCGMVFSLFVNAILTSLIAVRREELKSLLIWQMGSFALRGWPYVRVMLPFLALGIAGLVFHVREMDLLSFGEDEAASAGVESRAVRLRLLAFTAVLTGAAVSLSGAIGFVDLIAPHAARSISGSRHGRLLPMAALIGGSLMAVSDLAARTVISPSELPVGAVTALIGAPFFAWVYFRKGRCLK
jgi:iron complex transport system permease protein